MYTKNNFLFSASWCVCIVQQTFGAIPLDLWLIIIGNQITVAFLFFCFYHSSLLHCDNVSTDSFCYKHVGALIKTFKKLLIVITINLHFNCLFNQLRLLSPKHFRPATSSFIGFSSFRRRWKFYKYLCKEIIGNRLTLDRVIAEKMCGCFM